MPISKNLVIISFFAMLACIYHGIAWVGVLFFGVTVWGYLIEKTQLSNKDIKEK